MGHSSGSDTNQHIIIKYCVKDLYNSIRNTHDFFYRYCHRKDAAIAALTVAPFYMWKAERKTCNVLSVKKVVDIEKAFISVLKTYNQPIETAQLIVNEYIETYGRDHAKSQIDNEGFKTALVEIIIETVLDRTSNFTINDTNRLQISKHIESGYELITESSIKSRWS